MKIYVGNLSYQVTEEGLQDAFKAFGEVTSAIIIKDQFSGKSKGFGFVEMSSQAEAQAAIEGLNEKELQGRKLTVSEARPRADKPGGRGGRPGGGGGGRSGGGRSGGGRGGEGRRGGNS
ncbi:MAG: RNA-binding protein [Desulfurivibrio sp.]|nr:MAG: RNA-binding protein [Desulfurivibrio sp.]